MQTLADRLKSNLGNSIHLVLKSGEQIAAGIDKVNEAAGTVQVLNATGLEKLKQAEAKKESTNSILLDDNHYNTYTIDDITDIVHMN